MSFEYVVLNMFWIKTFGPTLTFKIGNRRKAKTKNFPKNSIRYRKFERFSNLETSLTLLFVPEKTGGRTSRSAVNRTQRSDLVLCMCIIVWESQIGTMSVGFG